MISTLTSPVGTNTTDEPTTTPAALFVELIGPVRCVVFDFDGPLSDFFARRHPLARRTTVRITRRLRAVLAHHGRTAPAVRNRHDPLELYLRVLETAVDTTDDESARLVIALRESLDAQELASVATAVATSGAGSLVRWLHEQGFGLGVASNNCERAIRACLEAMGLLDHFKKSVVGRDDDHRLMKPHPASVQRAMRELEAVPAECLMIGDSLSDIRAARSAGIPVCAYAPGRRKRRLLLAAGAAFAVGSMRDLQYAMERAMDPSARAEAARPA